MHAKLSSAAMMPGPLPADTDGHQVLVNDVDSDRVCASSLKKKTKREAGIKRTHPCPGGIMRNFRSFRRDCYFSAELSFCGFRMLTKTSVSLDVATSFLEVLVAIKE